MSDVDITQSEADLLIAMEKFRGDEDTYDYPQLGGSVSIPLVSADRRETFLLDISRGRIDLKKGTHQTRARQVVILVRIDFGGRPHRNPDGAEVPSPHIDLYREGYGDKWAFPIPKKDFSKIDDPWQTLEDFMRYCNITEAPSIRKGLFT